MTEDVPGADVTNGAYSRTPEESKAKIIRHLGALCPKAFSNEKYTGRVLLQKTISTGVSQIENDGLMDWYLYTGTHEAIISDEVFLSAQEEKHRRSKAPEHMFTMKAVF